MPLPRLAPYHFLDGNKLLVCLVACHPLACPQWLAMRLPSRAVACHAPAERRRHRHAPPLCRRLITKGFDKKNKPAASAAVQECSGNGVCDTAAGTCACLFGYSGPACTQCAPGFLRGPGGRCISLQDSCKVECQPSVEDAMVGRRLAQVNPEYYSDQAAPDSPDNYASYYDSQYADGPQSYQGAGGSQYYDGRGYAEGPQPYHGGGGSHYYNGGGGSHYYNGGGEHAYSPHYYDHGGEYEHDSYEYDEHRYGVKLECAETGTCSASGTCECDDGFTGGRCSEPRLSLIHI